MFSQGKAPATSGLFKAVVLTSEYAIDGLCPLEKLEEISSDNDLSLKLSSALVRPIGHLTTPEQMFQTWAVINPFNKVLALSIEDELGRHAYRQAFGSYVHGFPITVYANPFVIRGTAMFDQKSADWLDRYTSHFLPVADAQVTCEHPASRFADRYTPLLLVNYRLASGYSLSRP